MNQGPLWMVSGEALKRLDDLTRHRERVTHVPGPRLGSASRCSGLKRPNDG
jgi:hypothetical protein